MSRNRGSSARSAIDLPVNKEKSFTSLGHREITSSVKYVDPDLILESLPKYPSNPHFLDLPFPFPFGLDGLPEVDLNFLLSCFCKHALGIYHFLGK